MEREEGGGVHYLLIWISKEATTEPLDCYYTKNSHSFTKQVCNDQLLRAWLRWLLAPRGRGHGFLWRACEGNTIYIKLTVQKNEFTHQSNLLIDCQWHVPEYTTQLHYSSARVDREDSPICMGVLNLINNRWATCIFNGSGRSV